ncbi:hypothetical protein [Pontibacter russatus]|uniref:hypothetical protein n=1 Tax=Pontibacter russatus TaxID=2694929 RepID=UPI00137ABAF6|nr:hypothetical protein [Pontibacter russatus]
MQEAHAWGVGVSGSFHGHPHARDYEEIAGEPLYDPNRHTRARVMRWTQDGMPDFDQELGDNEAAIKKAEKQ